MRDLIFLIAILFTPDGQSYQDAVAPFETAAQCEQARRGWLKMVQEAKGFYFIATCTPARPVGSVDA